MKALVAFLWEEYDNIPWQRNYKEQLSQAVSFRQCCQIFHFLEHSWACGARMRNSTAAGSWAHWVQGCPSALDLGADTRERRRTTFSSCQIGKEIQFGTVRKESFKGPFPNCCFSKSFMLGFTLLTYLHCLYKTHATYIQPSVWFWANFLKGLMFF